jgi:hypothetical protein
MDSDSSSSTSPDASVTTDFPVINFARVLLWAKQHGLVVALAMFVLVDGGGVSAITGAIC